tara:strand:- start:211 stop:780 length:570 start_codon:yes stop_codon:yes gene_type:complete
MAQAEIMMENQGGVSFPMPENEDFRLEVLRSHEILNTQPEAQFDRIARLAAVHFGVPMSVIAMIDADRMWCKAVSGVDLKEAPRKDTFCAHTINETDVMIVPDAAKDSRFKDNPFVAGQFGLRFYVGAPLITCEGTVLGALCLLDTYPRPFFSPEDRRYLTDLAEVTVDLMEMRRALLTDVRDDMYILD